MSTEALQFFEKLHPLKRMKPWFSVTFNFIISHIFPENFIEVPQVIQNICRNSLSILAIFIDFHRLFGFFEILQRN